MLSMPPATIQSLSPIIIDSAPSIMAFIPEAQTLFIVVPGTVSGIPANLEACVTGACPTPAESTFPI